MLLCCVTDSWVFQGNSSTWRQRADLFPSWPGLVGSKLRCPLPTMVGTFCPPPPPGAAHFLARSGQGNLSRAKFSHPRKNDCPLKRCLEGEGKQSGSSQGGNENEEHNVSSAAPRLPSATSSQVLLAPAGRVSAHFPCCTGLASQERKEGSSHHCPLAWWCLEGWLVPAQSLLYSEKLCCLS